MKIDLYHSFFTGINEVMYKALVENEANFTFVCKGCTTTLPQSDPTDEIELSDRQDEVHDQQDDADFSYRQDEFH
jgi:hypothetical protein